MGDAEWAVTEPTLPAPAWTLGKGGRPAQYCRRDIVDGGFTLREGVLRPLDAPGLGLRLLD